MADGFYPAGAGLISYLYGPAYSAFGANRFSDKISATKYSKAIQEYFPGCTCYVKSEYFSEAPDYKWRVFCEGK